MGTPLFYMKTTSPFGHFTCPRLLPNGLLRVMCNTLACDSTLLGSRNATHQVSSKKVVCDRLEARIDSAGGNARPNHGQPPDRLRAACIRHSEVLRFTTSQSGNGLAFDQDPKPKL